MKSRLTPLAASLAVLVGLHFATRLYSERARPLQQRAFYSDDYATALALVAGKGFIGLDLADDPRPEAEVLRRFLRLDAAEVPGSILERYALGARPAPASLLASTRVLELRWAALVWRALGVRWSVLFASYAALSALVGLLVFLLGRRLGGGNRAGLLAALIFLASPLETESL